MTPPVVTLGERARRHDREHDRDVHLLGRRPRRRAPVLARRRRAARLHVAEDLRRGRPRRRDRHRDRRAHARDHRDQAPPARRRDAGRPTTGRSRTSPRPRRRSSSGPDAEIALGTPAAVHALQQRARRGVRVRARPGLGGAGVEHVRDAAREHRRVRVGLVAGVHTVLVRAVDPSGNADATPESYTLDRRRAARHGDRVRPGRRLACRPTATRRSTSPPTRPA